MKKIIHDDEFGTLAHEALIDELDELAKKNGTTLKEEIRKYNAEE